MHKCDIIRHCLCLVSDEAETGWLVVDIGVSASIASMASLLCIANFLCVANVN